MILEFFIPHAVAPKQTKANRLMKRKDGSSFIGRFTPADVRRNEEALASLLASHVPAKPLSGPVRARLVFQYSWRKSDSARRRAAGSQLKDTRPDCDNLVKNLLDVMERMGFFSNDAQVCDLHVRKVWTDSPGVQVCLSDMSEP